MKIQTKKKLWIGGFLLLPLATLFLPYVLFAINGLKLRADDIDMTFILLFGGYAFHTLLALSQLFLSLRILWFQKENRSKFSCRFHTIRFWVAFIFFVSIIKIVWFFIFDDDSLNLVLKLSYIYFFSCFFYFIFCILMNLINLGHWIYTKIPRKPKEEIAKDEFTPFQLEENEVQPSSRRYFWELTSLKKWVTISLGLALLLGVTYIFGYDANLPEATQTQIPQSRLEQYSPFYNHDMEIETFVEHENFKAIVYYRTLLTTQEEAESIVNSMENTTLYPPLVTYYTWDDENTKAAISPYYYTSLISKWTYGWYNYRGNLYADLFGKEKAKNVPNYRRSFRVVIAKEGILWDYTIFTNHKNPIDTLYYTIQHCNTLS